MAIPPRARRRAQVDPLLRAERTQPRTWSRLSTPPAVARIELKETYGTPPTAGGRASAVPVVVGADRRQDDGLVGAQRAVVRQRAHRNQLLGDEALELRHLLFAVLDPVRPVGIEADLEEPEEQLADRGIAVERRGQNLAARYGADLESVAGVGAQRVDLPPGHPGALHQPVEAVVARVPGPHRQDRLRQHVRPALHVQVFALRVLDVEAVDDRVLLALLAQFEGRDAITRSPQFSSTGMKSDRMI